MTQTHPDIDSRIMNAIAEEKIQVASLRAEDLVSQVCEGMGSRILGYLMFISDPSLLAPVITGTAEVLKRNGSDDQVIPFLIHLSVLLETVPSYYRVRTVVTEEDIASLVHDINAALDEYTESLVKEDVLDSLAVYHAERFRVEERECQMTVKELRDLFGSTLSGYIEWMKGEVKASRIALNTRRTIEESQTVQDVLDTMWGNDYGAFLDVAFYTGAMFQTTNPPLIKAAWDLSTEEYTRSLAHRYRHTRFDEYPTGSLTEQEVAAALLPAVIVESHMELLRGFYLYTEGRSGFVCYQVNPEYHNNSGKMRDEILFVHSLLSDILGGEPNVSFKIPGTRSGLECAQSLQHAGVSITVTLSFGLFQADAFARLLARSTAVSSFIVVMNGRLAFPVRDQLIALKGENNRPYLQASRLVGVEVTRKLFRRLYSAEREGGLALDRRRVGIMNASLRIYGDQIPDITQIWGSPAITIFPNARHALDSTDRVFDPDAIRSEEDTSLLSLLRESEIFRQAYYLHGDSEGKPELTLSLTDGEESAVELWEPIHQTLRQFLSAHAQIRTQALTVYEGEMK
ncbi:MAG: hypothetical protein JXK93_01100 [Sphaerochaetaceae bacterium]|nr:hypothetical protein [Sphaerochaetaceae bacterium]